MFWRLTRGDCLNCDRWYDFMKEPGIPLNRTPDDEDEIFICGKCQRNPKRINIDRVAERMRNLGCKSSDIDSARSSLRRFTGQNVVHMKIAS
jgi:hypothetical protein